MVSIPSRQFMVYKNLLKKSTGKQTMNERGLKHVPSLELDRSLLPYCVDRQASSARPSSVGSENRPTAMSSDGNTKSTDDSSVLRSNLSSELLEKSTSLVESEARNEASEQWVSVETAPVSAHAHCSSTTATNLLNEGEICVTSRELQEYGGELLGPDLSHYDTGDEEGSPLNSSGVKNLFHRERMHANGVVWKSVDPEGGSPFQLSKAQRISIQEELRRVAVSSGKEARLRERDPACAIIDVQIEERMDLHLNPNALTCHVKPDYHVVRGFHEETSCEYPNPRGSNFDNHALACTEREAAGNSYISQTEDEELDDLDSTSTHNTFRTQVRVHNTKPESFPLNATSKSDTQNHKSTGWEDPLSSNGTALIISKQCCTNMVSVKGAKVVGSSQNFHECKTEWSIHGSRKEKWKRCEEETRTNATEVAKLKGVLASSMFPSKHMGVCFECKGFLTAAEKVNCSRNDCDRVYHLSCAVLLSDISWSYEGKLICPQHVCYACGKNRGARLWRCQNCSLATHENCIPCPEFTTLFYNRPGWAICWRHASDVDYKLKTSTWDCQDIFRHLPVPDVQQEFNLTSEFIKEVMENDKEPPPYYFIRRNVFLIKKKRDDADDGVGCSCKSPGDVCGDDCECRVQSMSCSKDCKCSDKCSNKPFRKDKRLRVSKTAYCGWGAFAAEAIKKDDFIIEYTGEVINDAMCEKRLWEMKGRRSISNFYMCEIAKDFIIDATRKGNASRYLNHSCQPNCRLEKWRVDGETRVGVFAGRNIAAGEELNYDYKYVEFGPNVTCRCGAPNCRGAIGEKFYGNRKSNNVTLPINWGSQHKRSSLARRR